MQIHEVTRPITEGILKSIGQDIKGAVGGALDKAGAVLSTPGALTTARGYGAAIDQAERAQAEKTLQQQTQQHSKKLTQGWFNHTKSSGINPASAAPRAKPGVMPADFATSAQGQKTLQAYGPPRGGIQDIKSDDLKEQTGPDNVIDQFRNWSDSQLTGPITGTRDRISMDDVRQDPAEKAKLDAILGRIAQRPDDATAVEEYFTTAMQAMQRISAEKRASLGVSRGPSAASGDEILPQYIPPTQLAELKQLAKNPRVAAQIKRELGII